MALIAGILLAMGHHLFYQNLEGRIVGTGNVIAGVSKQQLNFALGTMFAFLVNSLLVLAVYTSYIQVAWKAIKKEETLLSTIDTIFSVTNNVYALAKVSIWGKRPLLLLLAATLWCIPISSVITPATLSVEIAPLIPTPTATFFIPSIDFLSLNFANVVLAQGLSATWQYSGPQFAVRKVATATAAQGAILPINHPAPNSSWVLDFPGPSLTCTSIQGQQHEDIIKNINSTVQVDACTTSYGYISWTPDDAGAVPFVQGTGLDNGTFTLRTATLGSGNFSSDNEQISDVASIYIATLPGMVNEHTTFECTNITSQLANATIIQCALFNTSYHASFEYVNGFQTVNVTRDKNVSNKVAPVNFLETNAASNGPLGAFFPNGTANRAAYNLTEIQTLAYQSVMDAFGQILVGSISNSQGSAGALLDLNTSVMSTVLSDTAELQFLATYPPPTGQKDDMLASTLLQDVIQDPEDFDGLSVTNVASSDIPLLQEIETLFQNITVSLMNSALLQPNRSSPYAPPATEVTLPVFQNVFVYSAWKLWVAYGISILLSMTGVIIGLSAMFSNGASYNNYFSTVLRTSKHAKINTAIHPVDATGREPLPKYLAKAGVLFPRLHDMNREAPQANVELLDVNLERKLADGNAMLLGPRGEGYEDQPSYHVSR
ncbi:hypothetical protein B7463_g9088, partial [Scytalidium lignicola]